MNIIPAVGATCLGMVIGWLVRYFIRRFDKFGPMVLGSIITIILGGAVIKFLEADKSVWWFYPIGLFLGFVIYHVIVVVDTRGEPRQRGSSNPVRKPSDKSNSIFDKSNPKYAKTNLMSDLKRRKFF